MREPVFLTYSFLFDALDTWQHLSNFESDLADFFRAYGLQAEIVKSMNGQNGNRVLILTNIDKLSKMANGADNASVAPTRPQTNQPQSTTPTENRIKMPENPFTK